MKFWIAWGLIFAAGVAAITVATQYAQSHWNFSYAQTLVSVLCLSSLLGYFVGTRIARRMNAREEARLDAFLEKYR